MSFVKNLGKNYTPFYFLSSLGSGGLAVSFFIYLFFMIPHKGYPMPTFNHIFPYIKNFSFVSILILIACALILYFSYMHFRLLFWNIKEYKLFKSEEEFKSLKNSNAEVSLMAIPLTYAMSINVCFVLGVVFVPNLWSIVEYLFPFALIGFLSVGIYALKIFSDYFVRLIIKGNFDFAKNNNLSQMVSIFAFAMVGVGFAAPGAMSHNIQVSAFGLFFAILFSSLATSLILVKITLGLDAIFKQGVSKESSVSLWIMIPILTLLGITGVRMTFGFYHGFIHEEPSHAWLFVLTSLIVSLQFIFGYIGYLSMKKIGYFEEFIQSDKKSPTAYAIICPGVAFFVFGMFFIGFGLVRAGIIVQFSFIYFAILIPFVLVQLKTIQIFFKLNKNNLKK